MHLSGLSTEKRVWPTHDWPWLVLVSVVLAVKLARNFSSNELAKQTKAFEAVPNRIVARTYLYACVERYKYLEP